MTSNETTGWQPRGYFDLLRHKPEFGRYQPKMRTRAAPSPRADDPTIAWLQAAPVASADALARLGSAPGPTPPPSTDSGIIWPRTETELAQALQSGADDDYVPMLHPRTELELTKTITIQQRANGGMSWGVRGNHARLHWVGPGGDDMLVYQGVNGVNNRLLQIEGFNFYGGGYAAAPAGACLKLYAPDGDPGCLYKFTLRDIFTSYATDGISIMGAVFEGLLDNCHGENHRRDGLHLEHMNVGSPTQAIVSNIASMHPNMSRNMGAGIRSIYSHNMIFGSFVLNAEGGVVAPEGLRGATLCNGENTGEAVFAVPSGGWGSTMSACEGSTDGSTHARAYEGGQWVSKGKPQLYLLDGPVDWTRSHVSYYGSGANADNVRVQK